MIEKFTPTHEWIQITDDEAVIGITHHAVKELGIIVFVELPKVGHILRVGQEASVVESTKAAVDICSPLTGKVIAVNQELINNVSLLNQHPEKEGWMYKIKISEYEEVHNLLDKLSYQQMIGS